MKKKLVSIVVPIYNMGNSLEVCVNSLLKQKYPNVEILLIDDGSQDNSLEVCNDLKNRDNRIQVYHTENRGSGPARNYGIQNANGKYIYFPDADDILNEDAISILVEAMDNGKYDLVVFGYESIDYNDNILLIKKYPEMEKEGELVRQDYSDYVTSTRKYGIQGAPWNKFFDLDLVKKYSIEYPPLRRHQDECFISLYVSHVKNIHFINNILYKHYVNDLKKEWEKYPIDYLDAVIGLFNTRKETVLIWNNKDKITREIVEHEYICNVIKALELSYSPKMKLDTRNRIEWLKVQIERSALLKMNIPNTLGRYQKIILILLRKNRLRLAMIIFYIKISIEKYGLIKYLRKLQ